MYNIYGTCTTSMPRVQHLCHVYNIYATCTTSMPRVQHLCHVYNIYGTCTTSMARVQHLWHVYNIYATCTTSMPRVQHLCHVYNRTEALYSYHRREITRAGKFQLSVFQRKAMTPYALLIAGPRAVWGAKFCF